MPYESEHNSKERWDEKIAELKAIKMDALHKNIMAHDEYKDFIQKMQDTYSHEELRTTRLWHLIIGSTVANEDMRNLDLPGGEIERFIREVIPNL